ncbi:hypothetical protein BS78_03G224300 [Paspalum vaginatum]|nr:hypothetical protein BS78_03G224300 [Paspalum vaginatum]
MIDGSIRAGGEERTPDPKPRWNPRPEQIRILESIFNSGMINPPRDEIPRIRLLLQEYGQPLTTQHHQVHQLLASPAAQAPTSSSSSSSDRSSGSSKPAAQPMSATAAMDLLGPLAAACPQMYYHQGQPVAPAAHRAVQQQDHLVASDDETIFQQWPQGCCLSAAEVAAILGGQYALVPAQQQPPALPAGPFLGLCNEAVTAPTTITGHRTCAWGAGLGQFWTGGGADHHQLIGRNTTAATNCVSVAREVAHDDATKLGLLQYSFGVSTDVEAASAAAVSLVASSPDAAVTVAATTAGAGLTGLPARTTAPAGVVANYDLLQGAGLAADGGAAAVGVTTTTSVVAPAAAVAAATGPGVAHQEGVAALCITDSVTGKSVAHNVAAARLDVRAQFGEAAALFRCVGERGLDLEHVPVDASSGCTVEPLQHGAFYYVLV